MTPATLKAIRLTHLYSGVFLAPAILFFAITGGLQMFGLHETSRGSSYKPPVLLMSLSQIHKKGTYVLPQRRSGPPAAPATSPAPGKPDSDAAAVAASAVKSPDSQDARREGGPDDRRNDRHDSAPDAKSDGGRPKPPAGPNPLPFKIFAAIVSLGLVLSTLTGLVMSWMYARRKALIVILFIAGILLPIFLLAI